MSKDIKLPDVGMGISEGTIVRWLKDIGDEVAQGDLLVEVETAKATVEVESPLAGRLAEFLALPGDSVEVDTVIARLS
jgi:pyruvate/2-oxoglutarate dehydrogenase complex dihydrolipoamide acyltransferase (E2) component